MKKYSDEELKLLDKIAIKHFFNESSYRTNYRQDPEKVAADGYALAAYFVEERRKFLNEEE